MSIDQPVAAPPRSASPSRTLESVVGEFDSWWLQFQRALAGRNACLGALQTLAGTTPAGERQRGLPIMSFPAAADGRTSREVSFDTKRIPFDQAQGFFVPAYNVFMLDTIEALEEIALRVDELRALLRYVPDSDVKTPSS